MTHITIVAVSHNEGREHSPIIDSMLAQKNKNWKLIVYNNGPWKGGWERPKDKRITYVESKEDTGMWGTVNRQESLKIANTDYIVQSSVQDYILPCFIEELNSAIDRGADFIHWAAINHLFRYREVSGEVAFGHLDWGQVCTKTEYMRASGIVRGSEFCSDWFTFQAIIQSGKVKSMYKIDNVMCIHN